MKGKRGMSLIFSTLVIIVLALLLLGVIIYVFSSSSGNFYSKIKNYFSESNVDDVVENCNRLAGQDSSYSYCCINKTIKVSSDEKIEASCYGARNYTWGNRIFEINCDGVC